MLATTDKSLTAVTDKWLSRFERALTGPAVLGALRASPGWPPSLRFGRPAPGHRERVDPDRTLPRKVTRADTEAVEAIFRFEVAEGQSSGVLGLTPGADGTYKAWTLHTALDALNGHVERVDGSRPTGSSYSRDFRGPNWLDLRMAAAAYADRDPAVLVGPDRRRQGRPGAVFGHCRVCRGGWTRWSASSLATRWWPVSVRFGASASMPAA